MIKVTQTLSFGVLLIGLFFFNGLSIASSQPNIGAPISAPKKKSKGPFHKLKKILGLVAKAPALVGSSEVPICSLPTVPTQTLKAEDLSFLRFLSGKIFQIPELSLIRQLARKHHVNLWLHGSSVADLLTYSFRDFERLHHHKPYQEGVFHYHYNQVFPRDGVKLTAQGNQADISQLEAEIKRRIPKIAGLKTVAAPNTIASGMPQPNWKIAKLDSDQAAENFVGLNLGLIEIFSSAKQLFAQKEEGSSQLKSPSSTVEDIPFAGTYLEPATINSLLKNQVTFADAPFLPHSFWKQDKLPMTIASTKALPNLQILLSAEKKAYCLEQTKAILEALILVSRHDLTFSSDDQNKIRAIAKHCLITLHTHIALAPSALQAKEILEGAINYHHFFKLIKDLQVTPWLEHLVSSPTLGADSNNLRLLLKKAPLPDLGESSQLIAQSKLMPILMAHNTRSLPHYLSMTRSWDGRPNVFISRNGAPNEAATYGDGFYSMQGSVGTSICTDQLTIRCSLSLVEESGRNYTKVLTGILVNNRESLRLIDEALDFSTSGLINLPLQDYTKRFATPRQTGLIARHFAPWTPELLAYGLLSFIHEENPTRFQQGLATFKKLVETKTPYTSALDPKGEVHSYLLAALPELLIDFNQESGFSSIRKEQSLRWQLLLPIIIPHLTPQQKEELQVAFFDEFIKLEKTRSSF